MGFCHGTMTSRAYSAKTPSSLCVSTSGRAAFDGTAETRLNPRVRRRAKKRLIFVANLAGLFDGHAESDDEIPCITVPHWSVVVADSHERRRAAVDTGVTVPILRGKDEMRGNWEQL